MLYALEDLLDDSFFLPLKGIDEKTGETKVMGYVRISITIMPKELAEGNKVGAARNEPNTDPYLPAPVGRISFSLNPFKMLSQLVGPAVMRKIYCACCCIICLALCVLMLPMILSQFVSQAMMSAM